MAPSLSTDELATIRDGLAAGRKPKVQFTETAGQIAGQIGQVVSLADPAVADEWVVVRFGRDELPFSPGDLRIAPRGAAARKAAPPPPPAPARPTPEFVIDKPIAKAASRAATQPGSRAATPPGSQSSSQSGSQSGAQSASSPGVQSRGSASGSRAGSPAAAGPVAAASGLSADAGPGSSAAERSAAPPAPAPRKSGEDVADAATPPAPRKAAPRTAKQKPAPALTVTLAYGEGEWTVSASQGAKVLAKPYMVRPAEALRMVSLVDVPGVQEAVEHILSAERAEAEQQAQRLRAELAEVEARLAELGEAGPKA